MLVTHFLTCSSSYASEAALDREAEALEEAHAELQIFDPDLINGGHGKNYVSDGA